MDQDIQITGRHLEITEGIRNAVNEKFKKLESHFPHITSIHVTLSVSKVDRQKPKVDLPHIHTVEVLARIQSPHEHEIFCKKTKSDLYASIDAAAKAMTRQLNDEKEKMQHRGDKITSMLRHQ